MGHIGFSKLIRLQKVGELHVLKKGSDALRGCEICRRAKLTALLHPRSLTHAKRPLAIVSSDLAGPMDVATPSGKACITLIVDHNSRYARYYPLRFKADAMMQWSTGCQRHSRRRQPRSVSFGLRFAQLQSDSKIDHQHATPDILAAPRAIVNYDGDIP